MMLWCERFRLIEVLDHELALAAPGHVLPRTPKRVDHEQVMVESVSGPILRWIINVGLIVRSFASELIELQKSSGSFRLRRLRDACATPIGAPP